MFVALALVLAGQLGSYQTRETLRVFCNVAGARVYIDGNYVGSTRQEPDHLLVDGLEAREYDVRVAKDDYEPWSRRLPVRRGVPNSIEVQLVQMLTHGYVLISYAFDFESGGAAYQAVRQDLTYQVTLSLDERTTTPMRFRAPSTQDASGFWERGDSYGSTRYLILDVGDYRLRFCLVAWSDRRRRTQVINRCAIVEVPIRSTVVPYLRIAYSWGGELVIARAGTIEDCSTRTERSCLERFGSVWPW